MKEMPRLGCAYPRCSASSATTLNVVAGRVGVCRKCGRTMIACPTNICRDIGTYNRPFARHCRRCGQALHQAPAWDEAQRDGWNGIPTSVGPPEVIADLSRLLDSDLSPGFSSLAMIRGALAVHQPGHFLALIRSSPGEEGETFLWTEERDPFPVPPDGSRPISYTPILLPGERHLLYSSTQGLRALDLWSCHGLSAKNNNPRWREIRCARRSIIAPPIPLGEGRIGLLTKGWGRAAEEVFRWAVWDLSAPADGDATFSTRLDAEDEANLPLVGKSCRAEEVDGRVIVFSTSREQWAWRLADAAASNARKMKQTWPNQGTRPGESIGLDHRFRNLGQALPARHAFLVQRPGIEKFSWFSRIRCDDPADPESLHRYEVDFESLEPTFSQQVNLPSGAEPIGTAPTRDGILQVYFRAGTEIWFQNDGLAASHYKGGLSQVNIHLGINGPLVISVGQKGPGEQSIQIDSLHDRAGHADISIGNRLFSEPLLWSRWLYTIECEGANHLVVHRRQVDFEGPKG